MPLAVRVAGSMVVDPGGGVIVASPVQAVALDYDGTLTDTDHLDAAVLASIRGVRSRGQVVVLVTGRILAELRAVFPEVEREFDAVVAENGAVLADGDGVQELAAAVDARLGQALARREIPVRQGRVLLACDACHAGAVVEEIARLELDCQVVRNRAALMVLPGGVTKGTGLIEALGNVGVSRHSTLAVGDAENDHHLLDVCELGVAVANAVESLKERADLVLEQPDGVGVTQLLGGPLVAGGEQLRPRRGPLVAGGEPLRPRRWQLTLGEDDDGNEVRIPASHVNLLITGASCSGKSYLAGLLVEQLVRLDYGVLVVDREGDHRGLAERRGILAVGGKEALPSPRLLAALLRHRFGSVVIDLSMLGEDEQRAYVRWIAPAVLTQRAVTGLPHWVFFDEAHLLPLEGHWIDALTDGDRGFCFTTYQPDVLPDLVRDAIDLALFTTGEGAGEQEALEYLEEVTSAAEQGALPGAGTAGRGRAVVVDTAEGQPRPFTVQRRRSGHVRHWHKYIDGTLPPRLRFYFTGDGDGQVAGNVREFHRQLGACAAGAVEAHGRRHDFSRWIGQVLQDEALADVIADAESQLRAGQLTTEAFRDATRAAIEARYLESAVGGAAPGPGGS
jgi:hydroxymethylpyrimidine pyrophosphatase-like HAD family hydrolase